MDEPVELSKAMRGAYSETLAAAWLMRNGYQVYTQIGLCLIDMIAYHVENRDVVRVEVKSATTHYTKKGQKRFYWTTRVAQEEHTDLILVVSNDGRVWNGDEHKSPVEAADVESVLEAKKIRGVKGRRPNETSPPRRVLDEYGNKVYETKGEDDAATDM